MKKQQINERFKLAINVLLRDKGLTKTIIANNLGIKPSKFSEILNNRMNVGVETIALLCEEYSFSAAWLLNAEGPMLMSGWLKGRSKPTIAIGDITKSEEEIKNEGKNSQQEAIAKPTTNPHEGIPLIPFEAMAGALTSEQTVLEYECERYIVPAFKGADFIMPVKGDSMLPTYKSGDMVACKRVHMSDRFFQWNKAYVVDTNQGPLIKRIKPAHDKKNLFLISDNTSYDPIELPVSAIHAVALVIGVIRLE